MTCLEYCTLPVSCCAPSQPQRARYDAIHVQLDRIGEERRGDAGGELMPSCLEAPWQCGDQLWREM